MYEFRLIGSETWIVPFQTISLTDELNVGVSGSISINFQSLNQYSQLFSKTPDDVFSDDYMEWNLYRDGSLLYAGVLQHRKISGSKSQGTSFNANLIGYHGLLNKRYTRNASADWFTSTDSADIAWSIINASNSLKDTGITRGLHPATVNRDRTYRYDNILDAIKKMDNNNVDGGYDWEIDKSKVFNIYYPTKGQTKNNIILDDFNIVSWSSDRDLSANLSNRVIVIGAGTGDAILSQIVDNATSQATWNLQEASLSEKSITTTTELTNKGNAVLTNKATPKEMITIVTRDTTPDISTYSVGDTVKVKIADLAFDQSLRIKSRTLQVETSGEAQVNLSFDYV